MDAGEAISKLLKRKPPATKDGWIGVEDVTMTVFPERH